MSSIEEQLVRDIAAVTGGVIVSDSDLLEARKALAERIDGTRGRARLRSLAPAAAAALVLVLVGVTAFVTLRDDKEASRPANPGPVLNDPNADYLTGSAPTAQQIEGVWRLDNGHLLVKFSGDGTVRFDKDGTLFSRPSAVGTYVLTGGLITVTTTQDAQQSCVGTQLTLRASLPEVGAMRYVPDTPFGACSVLPAGRGVLEQVLPTRNKDLAGFVFSTDAGWRALSNKNDLYGVWLAEGGGYLLEIDRSGAYVVADASGGPVDNGQWSLRGSDLTLTSAAGSTRCATGDRLVLGAMEQEDPGNPALRGTVKQNTCGSPWTPAAWVLIPNAVR